MSDSTFEALVKSKLRWCVSFNGTMHEHCAAGVVYNELSVNNTLALPCYEPLPNELRKLAHCAHLHFRTQGEAEEAARATQARLLARAADFKSGRCPTCKTSPVTFSQVGRCIYSSCGCRLGQGVLR